MFVPFVEGYRAGQILDFTSKYKTMDLEFRSQIKALVTSASFLSRPDHLCNRSCVLSLDKRIDPQVGARLHVSFMDPANDFKPSENHGFRYSRIRCQFT